MSITAEQTTDAKAKVPKRHVSRLRLRYTLIGWSFILPNFVGFVLLTLIPVVTVFYMSLTNWNIFGSSQFIGLDNFVRLAGDSSFHSAFGNTLYFAVLHIPLTIAVSLGLALLLNSKLRGVAFFRTAAFFPYITSIVAIALVWNLLLSPQYGPVNQVLGFLGLQNPPGWLTSSDWAMPAVVVVETWRRMGYYMVLFLAGLQTVPRELHEAARTDGANALQRFRHVTLPALRPTMFFVTVMLTIESLKILDLIIVLTDGGPGQATTVIAQFIWTKGFEENQFGYSSAASVVLFLLCLIVTIIQFLWNKRKAV
ncbi:carbohydrate ABC transporter permease [Microbacterium sp. MPKO10]|uniref:carbohydrate ABC transporter permease n=1 Tax=Microbacterium sp. MPKO10 TaxID=2989818 RepID=UPI0022360FD7|nr:sugar ABC transporter permease [Microbacterium sp. MPKO10]MCW4457130.1 sugar ABC transporter permease [Microbacterium sp. MPKO10]